MRTFLALTAAAMLALTGCAQQAPQTDQPVQVATAAQPAKQVCTRETKTGSNMMTTVCRPAGSDGQGAGAVDDFLKENQTTLNRVNGGFAR